MKTLTSELITQANFLGILVVSNTSRTSTIIFLREKRFYLTKSKEKYG